MGEKGKVYIYIYKSDLNCWKAETKQTHVCSRNQGTDTIVFPCQDQEMETILAFGSAQKSENSAPQAKV